MSSRESGTTYTYDCNACGTHLESLPGETLLAFSDRIYGTHTVHHDAQVTGLPVNVLRQRPCLALCYPPAQGGRA